MLFSSMVFIWIFLPLSLAGNYLFYKIGSVKAADYFLLAVSLFFYAWGEPVYILLMLAVITVNWLSGMALSVCSRKKLILVLCIVADLGILGYFKYAGMLVGTVNALFHTNLETPQIMLPVGISFFTFQALSYVADVYRKEAKVQKNWFRLALYISFFPQLIAGPIVRYADIDRQIENRTISACQTASGIRRFLYGFAKKVLLANVLGSCADVLYSISIDNVTGVMVWVASVAYTLQIYYDFSGYSDMAIGLGRMFGFEFKENFHYPYMSHSIREFWRRWHISLGSWFREYVYIPLGGSRKGTGRTYLNLILVFALTGFWHGASWTFVFWGLFHGCFLVLERIGLGKVLGKSKAVSWLYCMVVVHVGWVFFRTENLKNSIRYLSRMLQPWKYTHSSYSVFEFVSIKMIVVIALGILGAGMIQWIGERAGIRSRWKYSWAEIICCAGMFFLALLSLASGTYNPFIYFRF